jgi:hypothetical protein
MNGHAEVTALVSALVAPTSVSAFDMVFGNVLGDGTGFALGTGRFNEHTGEPAPASPPPPQPEQAPASLSFLPPPGLPPGPRAR